MHILKCLVGTDRHQCPNRQQHNNSNYNNKKATLSSLSQTNVNNKPSFYSTTNYKKSWSTTATTTPKPKCQILFNYFKIL